MDGGCRYRCPFISDALERGRRKWNQIWLVNFVMTCAGGGTPSRCASPTDAREKVEMLDMLTRSADELDQVVEQMLALPEDAGR
jgi:hypothetical protein